MKLKITLLFIFLIGVVKAQNLTFPVGIGTNVPNAWFSYDVLHMQAQRPVLRLSPILEGGLATILFKGIHNNNPGSPDEFHLNYVSSNTNPGIYLA